MEKEKKKEKIRHGYEEKLLEDRSVGNIVIRKKINKKASSKPHKCRKSFSL